MLKMYADGGCQPNPGTGTFGVVVRTGEGRLVCRMGKNIGPATNNIAEWRGALAALDFALTQTQAHTRVELFMDSRMVVEQLNGKWKAHHPGLKPLMAEGRRRVAVLRKAGVVVSVKWIPREQNKEADGVSSLARRGR